MKAVATAPAISGRAISFSGPMILAIRAGRKTVTRRAIKPQPTNRLYLRTNRSGNEVWHERWGKLSHGVPRFGTADNIRCPYGAPGSHLWIKEPLMRTAAGTVAYSADNADAIDGDTGKPEVWRWKPAKLAAMYMPRRLCRIWTEVVSVGVQRLHEITEVEAIDEGALTLPNRPTYAAECEAAKAAGEKPPLGDGPRDRFARKWDEINGAGSWQGNPWVWAITFKVLPDAAGVTS